MYSKLRSAGLALMLLAAGAPAHATLGEGVDTVLKDQAQLQAALEVTNTEKFAVHRLQLPTGTTVSEYVSPAGMVFAVSWQGPAMPDLQQLLGNYFAAYVEVVKNQTAVSGARGAEQSGLVVQTGGHMRAYFGRAYVATMLPHGVSAQEIQ